MYLHRDIHGTISTVFVPNGLICKKIFEELCRQEEAGLIHKEDQPWLRLENLASLFEEEGCTITAAILRWQKEKITRFYTKDQPSE